LRALIEPYAARLAVVNKPFSSEDLERLTSLVKTVGYDNNEIGFYDKVKADMEFHEIIYQECNNKLLINQLKSLHSLTFLFILSTNVSRSDRVRTDIAHRKILNAIMSGSPDKAEDLIRKHIVDTGEALVDRMKKIKKRE
jgi:GntR family transcriptional repressor for pyruvate dehydrogenase complex